MKRFLGAAKAAVRGLWDLTVVRRVLFASLIWERNLRDDGGMVEGVEVLVLEVSVKEREVLCL